MLELIVDMDGVISPIVDLVEDSETEAVTEEAIGEQVPSSSPNDYHVQSFSFVFAVLRCDIWRLTDLLSKVHVGSEIDHAPVLTAGKYVEPIASALVPPD